MHILQRVKSLRGRLWTAWSFLALLVLSFIGATLLGHQDTALSRHDLGLDFVAFYRAGVLVGSGHADRLYDLEETRQFDRELAEREGLPLGEKFGPFFNPPFLAWMYEPLSRLGYEKALLGWELISFGCFIGALWLLARMIPSEDWRNWGLVPALAAVSLPFLQTMGHAQNTCLSLLIVSAAVVAWRKGFAFSAGMVGGLLLYKPQLAAVILIGMVISLGWRALAGAILSSGVLVVINAITLPGSFSDYLRRLGPNVRYMMATHPYIWARHVTFRAFWQVLLNRANPGTSSTLSIALAIGCAGVMGIGLLACAWRNRGTASRDRVITAVTATAPLLMPYYLDYDLLLLAVPAVLLASEMLGRDPARLVSLRDRWLIRAWIGLYLLLMFNPALTQATQFNLCVPLLATIATISMVRTRSEQSTRVSMPIFVGQIETQRVASPWRALAS